MYLTFNEYREMGGALDETAFNKLMRKAAAYLDSRANGLTGKRIQALDEIPQAVRECIFELTEYFSKDDERKIASTENRAGNVSESITYSNTNSASELEEIVYTYLAGGGLSELLYRGASV